MKTWVEASIEEISITKTENGDLKALPYDDYYVDANGNGYGVGASSQS